MASMSMLEAAIRRTLIDAAKGRPRAQELVMKHASTISCGDEELGSEYLRTRIEFKVEGERELERRERLGIVDAPGLVPHPDNIVIDLQTGNVNVKGPMSREEKAVYDRLRAEADALRAIICPLPELLAAEKDESQQQKLIESAEFARRTLKEIETALSQAQDS